jgi:hypothetical protein
MEQFRELAWAIDQEFRGPLDSLKRSSPLTGDLSRVLAGLACVPLGCVHCNASITPTGCDRLLLYELRAYTDPPDPPGITRGLEQWVCHGLLIAQE